MKKFSIAFYSLGCKTNHYETDVIAQQFRLQGFELVDFGQSADVYLVNTCTVTGEADRKSRQILRRAKKHNPQALVVAMGCHAQLSDAAAYADICIGTQGKSRALALVKDKLTELYGPGQFISQDPADDPDCPVDQTDQYEELGLSDRQSETRAYLKIVDGCNSFCSYCAIPYARGRVRSRQEDKIIQEAQALVQAGYKEIVLTGIHLCSYGSDRNQPAEALALLAHDLGQIPGLDRIRLGSLDPSALSEEFLDILTASPAVCPHFHLSLQSGSDRILELMNRRYTTAQFRQLVYNIRERWPLAGINTDIITGFPGESDQDFIDGIDFCREMAFSRMHIFRFSPRQGTKAATMPGQLAPELVAKRSKQLQDLASQATEAYHGRLMAAASSLSVLVEERHSDQLMVGYSDSYAQVLVSQLDREAINEIVQVQINSYDQSYIYGSIKKQ